MFLLNFNILFYNLFSDLNRLRDKYDELARIFKGYADTVRFNETLFNGLLNYSKSCTLLADAKDIEIQRLQLHVSIINNFCSYIYLYSFFFFKSFRFLLKTIHDLAAYENVCKNARESLKHSLLQRGKEQLRQRAQQRNQVRNLISRFFAPFIYFKMLSNLLI